LPTGVAILSLGLIGLAGCERQSAATADPWPPEAPEIVLCPDDPRCGFEADPNLQAQSCRLTSTRHVFKCGEKAPYLRCPGPGCPTGQPSIPSQKCWISETLIDVQCPRPNATLAPEGAAPAAPSQSASPAPEVAG